MTSLFKAGGYKSYKNYLSRVKDAHVMAGHPWADLLQRVAQKCSRSALRGLAGPSRSEPFDLVRVFQAALKTEGAVCEGGPSHIAPMIVCATFFMLREIEASGVQVNDVTFGHQCVTLCLPVSKVDWKAKGARRTWQCICDSFSVCPLHVLQRHFENLSDKTEWAPLFPSSEGGFCTKDGVVTTIRSMARLAGQQVQDLSAYLSNYWSQVASKLRTGCNHNPIAWPLGLRCSVDLSCRSSIDKSGRQAQSAIEGQKAS